MKLSRLLTSFGLLAVGLAKATSIYNSIPASLPPNVPSLGYQATQTAEFGEYIQPAAGGQLTTVTVAMSDWALASTYSSVNPTWSMPLTLNIYGVDFSSGTPQPGALLGTLTETFDIPWRPEPTPTCGTGWLASDSNCYNGFAFTVTFDMTSLNIGVGGPMIWGLAFNTETWGANPYGVGGPYNSLNVGLVETGPSTGTNPIPDSAIWNTSTAAWYADGGAGGVGTFRYDTGWTPDIIAADFQAIPEPGTVGLVAAAGIGLGLLRLRRRS